MPNSPNEHGGGKLRDAFFATQYVGSFSRPSIGQISSSALQLPRSSRFDRFFQG
jgi:hypothetical protein